MAQITSPNAAYDGVTNGVQFTNGQGETNDQQKIQWFLDHGYAVDGVTNMAHEEVQAVNFSETNDGAAQPEQQASANQGAESDSEFSGELGGVKHAQTEKTQVTTEQQTQVQSKQKK
jgi:hypothetical protein